MQRCRGRILETTGEARSPQDEVAVIAESSIPRGEEAVKEQRAFERERRLLDGEAGAGFGCCVQHLGGALPVVLMPYARRERRNIGAGLGQRPDRVAADRRDRVRQPKLQSGPGIAVSIEVPRGPARVLRCSARFP